MPEESVVPFDELPVAMRACRHGSIDPYPYPSLPHAKGQRIISGLLRFDNGTSRTYNDPI
jgi:hypothetical protein